MSDALVLEAEQLRRAIAEQQKRLDVIDAGRRAQLEGRRAVLQAELSDVENKLVRLLPSNAHRCSSPLGGGYTCRLINGHVGECRETA